MQKPTSLPPSVSAASPLSYLATSNKNLLKNLISWIWMEAVFATFYAYQESNHVV